MWQLQQWLVLVGWHRAHWATMTPSKQPGKDTGPLRCVIIALSMLCNKQNKCRENQRNVPQLNIPGEFGAKFASMLVRTALCLVGLLNLPAHQGPCSWVNQFSQHFQAASTGTQCLSYPAVIYFLCYKYIVY